MTQTIRLQSLGECAITVNGTRIGPGSRALFSVALYLVLENARSTSRSALSELVWPDASSDRAMHSLRQVLYRLRALDAPFLEEGDRLRLVPDAVSSDLSDLAQIGPSANPEEVLERIPGGFLPGYEPASAREMQEWVDAHRARVHTELAQHLVRAIAAARERGSWAVVRALARRCEEVDPMNEEAALAQAEAIAMSGNKARAVELLDRFSRDVATGARGLELPARTLRRRVTELGDANDGAVEPPHVGRAREMSALSAALTVARDGRGAAFVISGPPGIGKSRLVREFASAAQLQGVSVATANVGRGDARRALGPWSDLAPAMLGMPGALGCDPATLSVLNRLTAVSLDAAPDDGISDAAYATARVRRAILDLVSAIAAERRAILVFEDVQWIDGASWDVIEALIRRVGEIGLVLLLTRREGEGEVAPPTGELLCNYLPLGRLDESECRQLLTAADPERAADSAFAAWCIENSGGNPYFLLELARHATRTDEGYSAPTNLSTVISARLGELTPVGRRVLQAAAILSRHATLSRVERVVGERRAELLDVIDELARRSLLRVEGELLVCAHETLSAVMMREVGAPSMRLMQRQSAMVLEEDTDAASSPAQLWDCARLWTAAGEADRAWRTLDACVNKAFEVGAIGTAIEVLDELLRRDETTADVRESAEARLARALYLVRDYPRLLEAEAKRQRRRGARAAGFREHSPAELYTIDAKARETESRDGVVDQLLECALDPRADAAHRVEAATIAIRYCGSTLDDVSGRRARDAVLPLLSSVSARLATEFEMMYEASFGDIVLGAAAARRLLSLNALSGELSSTTRLEPQCAYALYLNGENEAAYRLCRGAIARWYSLGMDLTARSVTEYLVSLHIHVGDIAEARRLHESVAGLSPGLGLRDSLDRMDHRIRLLLFEGRLDECAVAGREFFALPPRNWKRAVAHNTALRTMVRMATEGHTPDDAEMDKLIALHLGARAHDLHDFFVYMLTNAFQRRGERDVARTWYDEFLGRYRRERGPVLRQLAEQMER